MSLYEVQGEQWVDGKRVTADTKFCTDDGLRPGSAIHYHTNRVVLANLPVVEGHPYRKSEPVKKTKSQSAIICRWFNR